MTRDELIWLAGWLEGEGCFFYGEYAGSPTLIIQAYSKDRDVLEKVARLIGAKGVRVMPPRPANARGVGKTNGGFRTEVQAEAAAELMRDLLPLMGERRSAKIRECLAKWASRVSRPMEKLCACGCGRTIFGGRRTLYARRETGACAMIAFRARQKEIAA